MIKNLQLNNFKCFQQSRVFDFGKLNLLTGINGRGKSSLLQSLLILSQSAVVQPDMRKLIINGEHVELGNFDDIKNSDTPRGVNIGFILDMDAPFLDKVSFAYEEDDNHGLQAILNSCEIIVKGVNKIIDTQAKQTDDSVILVGSKLKRIHFVSADRLGPVKYVEKTNLPEFIHVGARGQHAINILSHSSDLPNVHPFFYRGKDAKSVLQQTVEWMAYILDGARIEIGGREKESSVLYMLLNNKPSAAQGYKPANVGFGYSYVLPLVITGLLAKAGEAVIIENPEAHLHPLAQSRIAEFFAILASTGVQVFVESHSEHILNGFRVSALRKDIEVSYQDLELHYFGEDFESVRLEMDKNGRIVEWPHGFFDQQEKDLADIFKLGR